MFDWNTLTEVPDHKQDDNSNPALPLSARYRCEQQVVNRIDGVVTSHADTKREVDISFYTQGGDKIAKTRITESIINCSPDNMMPAMQLINDIDCIKCDAELLVDPETGKIDKVLNLEDIKQAWMAYKEGVYRKLDVAFKADSADVKQVDGFTALIDKQFESQQTFLQDLSTKIFFDVFFDKYLLGKEFATTTYEKTFYSYLFDQQPLIMQVSQKVSTDEETGLRHISFYISNEDTERKRTNEDAIRNIYAQRYQPVVKYGFTRHNFEFYHDVILDERGLPTEIKVNIIEEVENNIEILITYRIHKLK